MKCRFVYLASVGLLASGMIFAQGSSQGATDSQSGSSTAAAPQAGSHTDAQGDLPAVKEGEGQSGKPSQANPKEEMPGSMGTATTPDQGTSPKGETPATGEQNGQKGTTDTNGSRPGVDPAAAPPTSDGTAPKKIDSNGSDTPEYAKPITSKEGTNSDSTSSPSQKSTDSGTASPK